MPQSQVGGPGGIVLVGGSVPPVQGTVTLAEAVAGGRVVGWGASLNVAVAAGVVAFYVLPGSG